MHAKKVPLHKNVDLKIIARGTPGFSGADLANLINEAALLAARKNRNSVSMEHLELAKDKIMMGAERKSLAMSDEEKKITAYHEGGHALLAHYLKDSDPIHKATIIPRGGALGMVMRLPERDRVSVSKAKLIADITVAMGGRVAEELIFGKDKITTGASSDIKMATDMARRMITEWGMSDILGPLSYGEPSQEVFLGHSVTQHKSLSEKTAEVVDSEIKKVVDGCYKKAHEILTTHMDHLKLLGEGLLEYETLTGEDIKKLLAGEKIEKPTLGDSTETFSTINLGKKTKKKNTEALEPEPGV